MADLIDPWASFSLDYDKLVNQFGIGKISDIIDDINNPQLLMKRGVIFGHREFNEINNLINQNKDFAVVCSKVCQKCFCRIRLSRTRLSNNHHV